MAESEIKKINGRTLCDEQARSSIPRKISQLTNDSGFIKDIPSEYVTETELTDKGFAKQTEVDTLSKEIVNLKQNTPSSESVLNIAQINALDGMFKKCAFTGNVTVEYIAFKQAFGIEGGGEEPDTPIEPTTPTLSSISATYTGGDVAVGTALTDLTGIAVTGTYSDGSTATITGYTLSGEIVEGINTITVSYSGKTATFTVVGIAEASGENNGWTTGVPYAVSYEDNKTIDVSTGEVSDYANWSTSDFMPCLGVSALLVESGAISSNNYLPAFDIDKNYLGKIICSTSEPTAVNRNVAYVRAACKTADKNKTITPVVYEVLGENTPWESEKYYNITYIEDISLNKDTGAENPNSTSYWSSGFTYCYGANTLNMMNYIPAASWRKTVCFYDADKNFISGSIGDNSPYTIPENAVYFRVSGIDNFEYTLQKSNRPIVSLVGESSASPDTPIEPDEPEVENNGWESGVPYTIEWTDGYCLDNGTGAEVEETGFSVSNFLPCRGANRVYSSGVHTSYRVWFYDENKNFLRLSDTSMVADADDACIPRDAYYMRNYKRNTVDAVEIIPYLDDLLDETTIWEADKLYRLEYENGFGLNNTTGEEVAHETNSTSNFALCLGATKIQQGITERHFVFFYDADKTFISYGTFGSNDKEMAIPENATYFRMYWGNLYGNDWIKLS